MRFWLKYLHLPHDYLWIFKIFILYKKLHIQKIELKKWWWLVTFMSRKSMTSLKIIVKYTSTWFIYIQKRRYASAFHSVCHNKLLLAADFVCLRSSLWLPKCFYIIAGSLRVKKVIPQIYKEMEEIFKFSKSYSTN